MSSPRRRSPARGCIVRAADRKERDLADSWATEIDYLGPDQGALGVSVRVYRLRPGRGAGPYHLHKTSESVYYVLSGSILVRLEDERYRLEQADLAFIPPDTPHSVRNAGARDALILELYAPAAADFTPVRLTASPRR